MISKICLQCPNKCNAPCTALKILSALYSQKQTELKEKVLGSLRELLNNRDLEPADDIENLANNIIKNKKELNFINTHKIKIGFARSFKAKNINQKPVYAECQKTGGAYTAFIPFNFIITIYQQNVATLSAEQLSNIIYNQLQRIKINNNGPYLSNNGTHCIEGEELSVENSSTKKKSKKNYYTKV
jgi:hypothetical protein